MHLLLGTASGQAGGGQRYEQIEVKMKRLLAFLAIVSTAHAVGVVQTSIQQLSMDSQGRPTVFVAAYIWTGDAVNGSVPSTSAQLLCCTGWTVATVEFSPGTPSPTNNYSATITDVAGADVLAGAANALSATVPQSFAASPNASPIQGTLSLNISGQAVAGAKGTVYVFLNRPGVINSAKLGGSSLVQPLNGGTGAVNPAAHTVAIAEGALPFNFSGPGSSGQPLVSNGAASDPTYQNLPSTGGGTGVSSPTAHTVAVAEGASPFTFAGPGTTGQPLVSNGAASDPTYQTLPSSGGGTGVSSPAAHATPIAEGASPFTFAAPGAAGQILTSNGAAADPTYQALVGGALLPAGTQTQLLHIQPNTGNATTLQWANITVTNAADYNFPAQTPGGSLVIGANTVTLTPCPLGVAGANANQFLYISGGVGTAEAVLLTGGTCAGTGLASGTVTFTAANTHSGAWTIQSATAGCQEDYYTNVGSGALVIQYPAGAFSFFAPCRISASGVWVKGAGPSGTTIFNNVLNSEVFQFNHASNGQGNGVEGIQLTGNASSATGYAIEAVNQTYFRAQNMYIVNFANGMLINGVITGAVRDVWLRNLVGDGFTVQNSTTNAMVFDDVQALSSTAYSTGIHITQCSNCLILHSQFLGANDGLLMNPANTQTVASVDIVQTYFDHGVRGIHINPATGGSVVRFRCSQCWAASNSAATAGVWLDSTGGGTIAGMLFENGEFSSNTGSGMSIDTGNTISIVGSTVSNNGQAGISFGNGTATATNVTVVGNRLGNALSGWGAGTQIYGIYLVPTTPSNITICGNVFSGNVNFTVDITGAMTGITFCPNQGIDDLAIVTQASAATITLNSGGSVNPNFYISGTTTTTTINGALWRGRKLTLIKTDVGSLTVGGGGNIPGSHTMTQNTSLNLTFDGTNWY